MKKVVLIGTVPNDIDGVFSGPQRVAYNIFKYVNKMDINIEYLNIGLKNKGIKRSKLEVYDTSIVSALKYILNNKPDIVHIVQYTGRSLVPFIVLKNILGYKLYYTAHGCIVHEIKNGSGLKQRDINIEKLLFKYSDKIFAVSEMFKCFIIDNYPMIDKDKVIKICNGIEPEIEYEKINMNKKYNISNKRKILLSVGVRQVKCVEDIITKYRKLDDDNYILVIVGNYKNNYGIELIKKNKDLIDKNKLIFTGELNQSELFSLYNQAFAYIQLSSYESFGLSVIEALSQNTPIIINNNIGVADDIDEQVKFIVNTDAEFNQCINEIDLNYTNIRELCKGSIKNLSWDNIAKEYYSYYS